MERQVLENIRPTRMELIRLKRRVKLAEKGRDLLKEKRDALVVEFFDAMRLVRDARDSANRALQRAHSALSLCYARLGAQETRQVATYVGGDPGVSLESRNVMGVVVPSIKAGDVRRGSLERGYTLSGTSVALDRAAGAFEEALAAIIDLSAAEERVRRVAIELEKTKRRVSALDNIVVPRMEGTIRMIEEKLEELERENFSRLKKVKAILTERGEEA